MFPHGLFVRVCVVRTREQACSLLAIYISFCVVRTAVLFAKNLLRLGTVQLSGNLH